MNQYIYVLRLISRLTNELNWTKEDNKMVEEHLAYLKMLLNEGVIILAGRTLNEDDKMFGIVIFEAETQADAQAIMVNDPAVKSGIMIAELHPYRVALIRK